jgi:hypothetical protein
LNPEASLAKVEELLKRRADPNSTCVVMRSSDGEHEAGISAMVWAAGASLPPRFLQLLLENGGDANMMSQGSWGPIDLGWVLDAPNYYELVTPLHAAAGSSRAICNLLSAGDQHAQDLTLLLGESLRKTQLLLAHGADANRRMALVPALKDSALSAGGTDPATWRTK